MICIQTGLGECGCGCGSNVNKRINTMAVILSAVERQQIRSVAPAAQREAQQQCSGGGGNMASAQRRQQ